MLKPSEVIYLHNLIGQLETLEVMYDGMVSKEIIDLIKQAKSQSQMELRKTERMQQSIIDVCESVIAAVFKALYEDSVQ